MRFIELTDEKEMVRHIQSIFGDFPLLEFLVETVTKLVNITTSSQDLQEILRWHERKKVTRGGDKVSGIEAHYKVKVLKKTKGNVPLFKSKDTVVLLAYKCIVYVMDLNPAEFPDAEELKQLTF